LSNLLNYHMTMAFHYIKIHLFQNVEIGVSYGTIRNIHFFAWF